MNQSIPQMTVDLKWKRFRLPQSTLQGLGNPDYIQFSLNGETNTLVIMGAAVPLVGRNKARVSRRSDRSTVEFRNPHLLRQLWKVLPHLDGNCSYFLQGELDGVNQVVYYNLDAMEVSQPRRKP